MIPKTIREGATASNLPGETARFTIAANGKAFRTLIDGLYSNKVQAVIRELCSNAADSHIDAGNPAPFDVTIPTHLHPVFRVRDYGTGLTHDQVMHLYTTIFQSTKETTNDQTGQLGLGSKSPFAYTDSFQVTVWQDGMKRSYIAFLETDGVPSIRHHQDEPSNEPRGLEVSFAAERDDIRRFQKEMQFVSMGYDVKPNVEGMDIAVPTPRLTGEGWAIYPNGSFGEDVHGRHFIRQGSAVYPNSQYPFPNLGHGWISVVDIPIGTAEVTASREAISYDRETIEAVSAVLDEAEADLKGQIEAKIDEAQGRVAKARVFAQYNGIFYDLKGSVHVSLLPDDFKIGGEKPEGCTLEKAEFFGKAWPRRGYHRERQVTGFEVQNLDRVHIIVNDAETKVVRRQKRIKTYADQTDYFTYVLDVEPKFRKKAIANIKACLEINDDRFVVASELPDVAPEKRVGGTAAKARRTLPAGQYWMPRYESRVISSFGTSEKGNYEWPRALQNHARVVGMPLDWSNTFFVTRIQYDAMKKRGELPENRRLDVVLRKKMEKALKTMPLDQALAQHVIDAHIDRYNTGSKVIIDRFFGDIKRPNNMDEILGLARNLGVKLETLPIHAKITAQVEELQEKFPLCFRTSDRAHYEQYIDAMTQATA